MTVPEEQSHRLSESILQETTQINSKIQWSKSSIQTKHKSPQNSITAKCQALQPIQRRPIQHTIKISVKTAPRKGKTSFLMSKDQEISSRKVLRVKWKLKV